MESGPVLVVVAGSNGAGKSTFVEEHLAGLRFPFVNADLIAREIFGSEASANAYAAAEIAESRRRSLVAEGRSFIMETVFSDPVGAKVGFMREAQAQGYFLSAHFIGLHPPELAVARVIQRVEEGGHDVPDEKILARYHRALTNLGLLIEFADELTLYDNSFADSPHRPVARFERGRLIEFADPLPPWTESLDLPNFPL